MRRRMNAYLANVGRGLIPRQCQLQMPIIDVIDEGNVA